MCNPVDEITTLFEDIGDALGDAADWVIDEVIDPVTTTVGNVIQAALDNPIKTIAQVAAVATGNAWALPLIEGADVAAKGGNIGDVLAATAKAYVIQEVGSYAKAGAGSAAGSAATQAGMSTASAALAAEVIGSAASAASVAVVSGQDPAKAFVTGGLGAAVPAVLGKVDTFKGLPPSAQRVISAAVAAQLSGGNVTTAIINSAIASTDIVSKALKSFDPDGTKLDNTQRAILTDVLMGTASAALTGGSPANVVSAAMMKAGSKALGDMATDAFKTATTEATTAYAATDKVAGKLDSNRAAQVTAAENYNSTATMLQSRLTEQERLRTAYNDAVAAHNANPSADTAAAANTAIKTFNEYVTGLNKDYAAVYKPQLDKYGTELDTLKQSGAVLTGDYEKAIQAFATKTDKISEQLDPIYITSNRAFVEVMDEKFDPEAYRKLNGLAADEDPYEHFLSKGQFENAPTNNAAAEPAIAEQRTRLVNEALASKGINPTTADPAMVATILGNIDAKYGSNINAMKTASADDVVKWSTTTITKLATAQQNGTARVGTVYGDWKKLPANTPALPAGLKLATFESFNSGNAAAVYDTAGNTVWVEPNRTTMVASWNPTTGTYEFPPVVVTAKRPTEQERILAMAELGGEDAVNGVVSQGMINAAKTLVGWAKDTGNSTIINTAANVIKAGGGFIESINGISALFGAVPKDTAMGKFANALNNVGKAGNTAQYQAAIKDVKDMVGNAKGVGGTLAAIYKGATTYPLEFAAEFIGVEGFQEIAPFLIGGGATTAVKGLALAKGLGTQLATRLGGVAGMTAAISTDVIESAGGAAAGAFDEAYKLSIKSGKTEAESTKIALDVAQKAGIVSGLVTAVSMGLGGGALEKAIFNGKVSGTGFGDALTKLGEAAKAGTKITIKEGLSEGGEEGITQAFLEGQLYKLDPNRDVAANITAAAAFGAIAGGPIAGTAYAGSQTGDVISNALQANPQIANILVSNKGNPAAADAALANFGITDNTIKSNLMNVVDDANYTSSQEAADTLAKRGDYSFTSDDVTALTGKAPENNLEARVEAYVDPKVLDIEEVKAAAKAEGYTLTDAEAQKLVGQKDEIAAVAAARAEFDPKATTYEEAKTFLTDKGYTPTADEIKQFVGDVAETKAKTDAAAYVNPRQVTTEEARKYLTDQGYTPSDADVNRFVGQVNQEEQAGKITAWVDPRVVDKGEVEAAYEALGLAKPTDADIAKLMGQYDESGLTAKATEYLPTARYNSLVKQLEDMTVGATPEAIQAIELVRTDLTKSIAATGLEVAKLDLKIDTAKADLEEAITTATSGLATPADIDAAIAKIEFPAGISKEDVSAAIKTYMEANPGLSIEDVALKIDEATAGLVTTDALKTEIAAALKTTEGRFDTVDKAIQDLRDAGLTADDVRQTVDKIVGSAGTDETVATGIYAHIDGVNTKIDNINTLIGAPAEGDVPATGLYAKIAENEAAGMTRDEATQKAIADVATDLGTTKTDLLTELGITEGNLTRKIEGLETALTATEKNILDKVKEYEDAGKTRDEATQLAIETVATELGTTKTALLEALGTTEENLAASITDLGDTVAGLSTKLTEIETNLLGKIATNEEAGLTRDEATQKAVSDLAVELGTTRDDVLTKLGTTETALNERVDTLETNLSTKLADAETNIYAKMAAYEKTGISRDEALAKAIDDVSGELGTTKEDLLKQLGTTEANLKADVAAVETNLGVKIADSEAAVLKQLGLVKTGLSEEIAASEGKLTTKIEDAEANILAKASAYEKAGITRDEALSKAIDDVSEELGTTRTDVLTQLGKSEATLKADIAKSEAALTAKIGGVETTLGRAAVAPTQSDLDAIIQNLESQGAYDPQYDYNGDKVIDQNDRVAIENYLESQQPGYVPDTDTPFIFTPAAGSKFAPTGVFKTVAEEAAATRAAAAADAEKTRQAQAAAALKTQRMGNLNTLTSMLGQAGDTGGQQVTVKGADPTKIGYIYDFSSIFANPSQEKMFASPFAEGGMVDGYEDVNDELLKFLKG